MTNTGTAANGPDAPRTGANAGTDKANAGKAGARKAGGGKSGGGTTGGRAAVVAGLRRLVTVLVILGGVSGLGAAIGLGPATILAGIIAMFCFIAAFGGPLRADLRLLAVVGPLLIISTIVPRLLAEISVVAALAVLTVIIFASALIPAFGARYVSVGMGVGMASTFAYGFKLTGAATIVQLVGAPVLAVVVVVLLRLLMGASDPSGPTRAALADAINVGGGDASSGDTLQTAAKTWYGDRARRWGGQVLAAAFRVRSLLLVLDDRGARLTGNGDGGGENTDGDRIRVITDAARDEAAGLAEAIRTKDEKRDPYSRPSFTGDSTATHLVTRLWAALDDARNAVNERDSTPASIPPGMARALARPEFSGVWSWQSAQLRHALRCALGMLAALLIAHLSPGDPLTVSFLMATFTIMQPKWRDSLTNAWRRVAGAVAGAVVLAAVLWLLPAAALVPIALVAVLVGFTLQQTNPLLYNASMVLMVVGMNVSLRHLEPNRVVIEYLVLILIAAAIGVVFGFVAIPGVRRPGAVELFRDASDRTRELVTAAATAMADNSSANSESIRTTLPSRGRAAARAQQNLVSFTPGRRDSARTSAILEQASENLRGLVAASTGLMLIRPVNERTPALLERLAAGLNYDTDVPVENILDDRDALPPSEEEQFILDAIASDVVRLRELAPQLNHVDTTRAYTTR